MIMEKLKNESVWMGALIAGALALLAGLLVIYVQNQIVQGVSGILTCCGIPFIGAFITIWHYSNAHGTKLNAGDGAGLGALALSFGAIISGVLSWVLQTLGLTPSQQELLAMQKTQMTAQWRAQGMSDEQIDTMVQQTEKWTTMLGHPLIAMLSSVVVFAIMGAICGAIVAAIYKPKS